MTNYRVSRPRNLNRLYLWKWHFLFYHEISYIYFCLPVVTCVYEKTSLVFSKAAICWTYYLPNKENDDSYYVNEGCTTAYYFFFIARNFITWPYFFCLFSSLCRICASLLFALRINACNTDWTRTGGVPKSFFRISICLLMLICTIFADSDVLTDI